VIKMNWIKFGAISGIGAIIISFLFSFINAIFGFTLLAYFISFISTIGVAFFYFGFFVVGKKYKKSLLKTFSIYFIIITIVFSLASVVLLSNFQSKIVNLQEYGKDYEELLDTYGSVENIPKKVLEERYGTEILEDSYAILKYLVIGYFVFFFLYGIPKIFFGIGLLKLGKKVRYSKVTGILDIVGGATTIIFIGYFVLLVAWIFELILLFSESRKLR